MRRLLPLVLALPLAVAVLPALPAASAPTGDVRIEVLSGRGDLVTGGDALVRVVLPAGATSKGLRVDDDGRDVTAAFQGRLEGLVTGLSLGKNVLRAVLPDGRGARITLTNAPIGGPVFSGPQIQPWACSEGAKDAQCNREPVVTYSYKPTGGGALAEYDPASPPTDVATTTTDEGTEVPFIVREETGVSLRDEYKIAALFDPAKPVDPAGPNPGFANKLVLTHGASCDTSYEMGSAPDVLLEDALAQGFAVASHALDNAGHNCNLVTQAESLIVTKELVAERFGPITYTIGSGCSGGSLVQQQVANAYPGVYQGIIPQCSFTDAWSSAQQYVDYVGLREYLEGPGTVETGILPAQWPSIFGHANPGNQITFTTAIPNSGDPSRSCPGVPEEDVYSQTNKSGVRCSFQDYMVNVFGKYDSGPEAGKARRPISNVGIQYGLSGLLAFLTAPTDPTRPPLTPAQFVALNKGAGGYDLDFNRIPERTTADPLAMERVYRSGAVNTGAHLDEVPIIDLGGPEPGAFHDVYRKYSMRDRLVREHGTAANQVFWEGQTPLLGDVSFVDDAIRAMDDWLAAIQADTSRLPLARKVLAAKEKAGVTERCVGANGVDVPLEVCDLTVDATIFSSPRIEAGGGDPLVGFTDDRLDCQTVPLESYDYAGQSFTEVFTAEEQATLKEVYPTGVCDYSKPGKGFQAATTWLTYQDAQGRVVYGGTPMGAAPVSVPFRGAAAAGPAVAGPGVAPGQLPATGASALLALG
ncbi:MAG: N-acetylmuramoyl-L-alanine amidase, partial [Frankiales bacterium]|nr:N-acetylmuramoyl-L-alanine amidase [Frankiales bacterium]